MATIFTNPPNTVGPTQRPNGDPLELNDIWFKTGAAALGGGTVLRWDGGAFVSVVPQVTRGFGLPSNPNVGDVFVHSATGAQAQYDGSAWNWIASLATDVPSGGLSAEHLEKKSNTLPFDTGWVDAAAGIAYLHEQRTAADEWTILHNLRSEMVAVTVIDDTRNPHVVLIPEVEHFTNQCNLKFESAVSGFAVVHASRLASDATV